MKKIFKEAHKMTREMVKEYKVDYQAQFSINLSYLLNNKEEKEMERNLRGSEKQIKWANDLLNHLDKYVNRVLEGYEKGEALEEEKEEFDEFLEEEIDRIRNNEKSWEIIAALKERNKNLWLLEEEGKVNYEQIEKSFSDDEIEFEYNLAEEVKWQLEAAFKN